MLIGLPNAIIAGSSGGRFQLMVTAAPTLHARHVEQSDGMFEERENKTRDVVVLLVQGKMAGVEQVDFGQIALERLRTGAMNEGSFGPQTTKIGGLCSATMLATRSANIR